MSSQGVRRDPLVLDVREPRSPCFLLGERDAVAILLGLAVEQTELGSLERCGDDVEEGGGREHGCASGIINVYKHVYKPNNEKKKTSIS